MISTVEYCQKDIDRYLIRFDSIIFLWDISSENQKYELRFEKFENVC